MARNSIGLIELSSIAAGFLVCDAMLKAADVELVLRIKHLLHEQGYTIAGARKLLQEGGETSAAPPATPRETDDERSRLSLIKEELRRLQALLGAEKE